MYTLNTKEHVTRENANKVMVVVEGSSYYSEGDVVVLVKGCTNTEAPTFRKVSGLNFKRGDKTVNIGWSKLKLREEQVKTTVKYTHHELQLCNSQQNLGNGMLDVTIFSIGGSTHLVGVGHDNEIVERAYTEAAHNLPALVKYFSISDTAVVTSHGQFTSEAEFRASPSWINIEDTIVFGEDTALEIFDFLNDAL